MPSVPNFNAIPDELRGRNQWICWAVEARDGKPTKVPKAAAGGNASSTDASTWCSCDKAVGAYLARQGSLSGIGFVFADDRSVTGLDLDHVLDAAGNLAPEYQWVVREAGTYTEVSPSGDGLHLLFLGGKPEGANKCKKVQDDGRIVEMYDHGRFFTFTGNVYTDSDGVVHDAICANNGVLDRAYRTWVDPGRKEAPAVVETPPAPFQCNRLDDDALLDKMFASEGGARIRALFGGDRSGNNGDDSSADISLCNHLAWWTNGDAAQMDAIFRRSGLMRPKWDEMRGEKTYGQMTIDDAIAKCRGGYDPNYKSPAAVVDGSPPSKPSRAAPMVKEIVAAIEGDTLVDALRFNVMDKRPYVRGVLPWGEAAEIRPFENADRSQLFAHLQDSLPKMKSEDFNRALDIVFDNHKFNPIEEALLALPKWDGVSRVGLGFQMFLGAEDSEYVREVERLNFRASLRRARRPGCKFDIMTVLSGAQGIGKSSYCRAYALDDRFFTDSVYGIGTPVASTMVQGKTVVEVAELASFSKKQVEVVKSWITQQSDDYVPKYVRDTEHHPRYFIIFGTTNNPEFLTDQTGNRRFAPIRCGVHEPTIPLEGLREWMRQAWAEAIALFSGDEDPLVLPESVMAALSEEQDMASVEDGRIGLIGEWLDGKTVGTRICAAQVVQECLDIPKGDSRYKAATREVGEILTFNFPQWERQAKKKSCGKYGAQRVFELLPDIASLFAPGNGEIGG